MRGRERPLEWDDEPIGDVDHGVRRHWRRPWNAYLTVILGFAGAFMLLGSLQAPSLAPKLGGVLVLLGVWALARSEGPHRRRPPRPPAPGLRVELAWAATAAALVVGGVLLFGLD